MANTNPNKDLSGALKADEAAFDTLAANAPSDIKGDFQTFASAFKTYADAIQKSGYKVGSIPSASQIAELQKASQALDTQKLKTAEQHLSAWAQKNCSG